MIDKRYLDNFTCFTHCELPFCKGINVFIGRNGTGKTHILKCMAALMKANALFARSTSKNRDKFADWVTEKLLGYFKPDILGHLVNKFGPGTASVQCLPMSISRLGKCFRCSKVFLACRKTDTT